MESLRMMMGGTIKDSAATGNTVEVYRNASAVINAAGNGVESLYDGASNKTLKDGDGDEETAGVMGKLKTGSSIRYINFTKGIRGEIEITDGGTGISIANLNTEIAKATDKFAANDEVRFFWIEVRSGANKTDPSAVEITISPNTFPGSFRIVGDTFIRDQKTVTDSAFQFVIENAKVSSNVTITLQAEGDPSTFSMTVDVLRKGEEMMKLIRY